MALIACAAFAAQAQVSTLIVSNEQTKIPILADWSITARDQMSITREYVEPVLDASTGKTTNKVHRIVEVGNGLNYQDASGQWHPSQDLIELMPDGSAAATHGPLKVFFSPNLNTPGAISLITASNRVFKTHVLGLYYFDAESGKSALLASPQDSTGELLPPNQVIYKSAFGPLADVSYTYTKGGFESDIVLRQKPRPPEDYGLNPETTRLEVWHEWLDAPEPIKMSRALKEELDLKRRSEMAEPDLMDEILKFGEFLFPQGKAFAGETGNRNTNIAAQINLPNSSDGSYTVPMGKQWRTIEGRNILIEAVDWQEFKFQLIRLPQFGKTTIKSELKNQVVSKRQFPNLNPSKIQSAREFQIATSTLEPGVILDYVIVIGGGDYEFLSMHTYYVQNPVVFWGTVQFSPYCVIKYTNNVYMSLYGTVSCWGTCYDPTVLTSMNDSSYGEVIPVGVTGPPASSSGTNCPTSTFGAQPALYFYDFTQDFIIRGLKICWAKTALHFVPYGACMVFVRNCQLEWCQLGICAEGPAAIILDQSFSARHVSLLNSCGPIYYNYSSECGRTSLADHIIQGMETLTSTHSPSTGRDLFSDAYKLNHNPNCLIYGIPGYTSFIKRQTGFTNCEGDCYGATMITPRHAVTARHVTFPIGSQLYFVGRDNQEYERTCIGFNLYGNPWDDRAIILLNSDVPVTVDVVKVFPAPAIIKLPYWQWRGVPVPCDCLYKKLPMTGCNYHEQTFAVDLTEAPSATFHTDNNSKRFPSWQLPVVDGDSGTPAFILIKGELVLMGAWWTDAGIGSAPGGDINALNNAIYDIDQQYIPEAPTGYQATVVDLSDFPDFPAPPYYP
jgi:hypothetical protein